MSKEAKNEIDLMLRQLGRRDGAAVFESDEQHLDADELNSYVANALPGAARARYMEHLADCASCRRLVAQLSTAQGPVAVGQAGSVPAPSGLKQFLASLLSPMVLRYAAPALGVLVIAVIGFVVMRRQDQRVFTAQVKREQNDSVAVQASPSPTGMTYGLTQETSKAAAGSSASPQRSEVHDDSSTGKRAEQTGTADTTAIDSPAPAKTQPFASEPAPVEAAPKVAAKAEAEEDEERRADREKKVADDVRPPAKLGEVTVKQREEQNKAPETQRARIMQAPAPAAAPTSSVGGLAKSNEVAGIASRESAKRSRGQARDDAADKTKDDAAGARAGKEKNEAEAETRSVAGRHFRKTGNVWIDTAYDESQQTFRMARGSEQYRTLVADEPDIRKIADELDGEFIVVWKGRAYRIR